MISFRIDILGSSLQGKRRPSALAAQLLKPPQLMWIARSQWDVEPVAYISIGKY